MVLDKGAVNLCNLYLKIYYVLFYFNLVSCYFNLNILEKLCIPPDWETILKSHKSPSFYQPHFHLGINLSLIKSTSSDSYSHIRQVILLSKKSFKFLVSLMKIYLWQVSCNNNNIIIIISIVGCHSCKLLKLDISLLDS